MDAAPIRVCRKCGPLPASEFYRHSGRQCKACTRARVSAYRKANIQRVREWDKIRGKFPERAARMYGWDQKYKSECPEKVAAHRAVKRARESGLLVPRPCEKCGNTKVDAHHDDYSKPLEVRWLCRVHHAEEHHKAGV